MIVNLLYVVKGVMWNMKKQKQTVVASACSSGCASPAPSCGVVIKQHNASLCVYFVAFFPQDLSLHNSLQHVEGFNSSSINFKGQVTSYLSTNNLKTVIFVFITCQIV